MIDPVAGRLRSFPEGVELRLRGTMPTSDHSVNFKSGWLTYPMQSLNILVDDIALLLESTMNRPEPIIVAITNAVARGVVVIIVDD